MKIPRTMPSPIYGGGDDNRIVSSFLKSFPSGNGTLLAVEEGWGGTSSESQGKWISFSASVERYTCSFWHTRHTDTKYCMKRKFEYLQLIQISSREVPVSSVSQIHLFLREIPVQAQKTAQNTRHQSFPFQKTQNTRHRSSTFLPDLLQREKPKREHVYQ